jgi:hypothetical protein
LSDAIVSIVHTYLGLALVWPVAITLFTWLVCARYGAALAHDLRRIVSPALGLLFLAAPLVSQYPFLGLVILGLWVAYTDHLVKTSNHAAGEDPRRRSEQQARLRSLLGTDDSPFQK